MGVSNKRIEPTRRVAGELTEAAALSEASAGALGRQHRREAQWRFLISRPVMLPLMQFAGDGEEHSLQGTIDALADQFGLTPSERKELLPSGQQEVFDNQVGAGSHLPRAGLLGEDPSRLLRHLGSRSPSPRRQSRPH